MRKFVKHIKVAFSVGFLATLLALFGHSLALEPETGNAQASRNPCLIMVDVEGEGKIQVQESDQEPRSTQSDLIAVDCNKLVTLTAKPEGPWKFERWVGVESPDSTRPRINVFAPAKITAVFSPLELTYIPADEPYYNRAGELVDTIPLYESVWRPLDLSRSNLAQTELPDIEVWYGDPQPYGQPGVAQKYYDILGTVSDVDMDLVSLEYSLNGEAPISLSYGGDGSVDATRRLINQGDFVVDLDRTLLKQGLNTVSIKATDSTGSTTLDVTVDYSPSATGWPLPSNVIWNELGTEAENLLKVAQVVDGKWEIVADGVRTKEIGYDRLLNVGDINWTSYEALVPVTVHNYELDIPDIHAEPALGLVLNWDGHTDNPDVGCVQPKCGWLPIGMANWYIWDKSGNSIFSMWVHNVSQQYFPEATKIEVGSENHYLWKVQVDRDEGPYGTYRSKFWPANEPEPDTWLEKSGTVESKIAGSLLLLAHHVDVTFGDVKLRELGGDFDSPVISELQIEALVTEAVISWKTDELSTCDLTYWDDAADKNVIAGDHLVSQHAVSLENLESSTTYDLLIRCEDDSLNESTEEGEFETDVQLFALEILPSSGGKITVQDGYSDNLYQAGEMVTLNAEADPNKKFVKWTVFVEGVNTPKTYVDNPLPLEIIGDTTVTVLFGNNEEKIYIPLVQFSN